MLRAQPNQPPVVGDRFQLIGTIDHQGSTWQYLGWDTAQRRWCTVRMLGFNHVRDPMARARFERQVNQLERVSHHNVLPVYSADSAHPTHPWIATAVAEGGSIADWMNQNGVLPPYLAIDVMAHVCSGLAAAHAVGASHGGLRVEQVLINRHGQCMITGLRGGGERADIEADLKGAGALLYTMLTGQQLDDKHAAAQLRLLPVPIARAIEQTRRGRGGFANVAQFSRDLEAGVLELPPPDRKVPPLAGPEVALGNDPMAVWNPATVFHDIQHLVALGENPQYTPAIQYFDPTTESGPPAPALNAAAFEEPAQVLPAKQSAPTKPRAYQMSRAAVLSKGVEELGNGGYNKPLYEEPPPLERWSNWDPDLGGTIGTKKEKVVEENPYTELFFLRIAVLSLTLLFGATALLLVWGIQTIATPRAEAERAASEMVEVVRRESALVYELSPQGVNRSELEAAYFDFSEARNEILRIQRAITFSELVQREAERARLDRAGAAETDVAQRVNAVQAAYANTMAKRAEWERASQGFPGVISVAVGFQFGPTF